MIGTSMEDLVVTMNQTSLPAASPPTLRPVFKVRVAMQFYDNGGGSADDPGTGRHSWRGSWWHTSPHKKSSYAYTKSPRDNGENPASS